MLDLWYVVGIETPVRDKPSHFSIDWGAFTAAFHVGHHAFEEGTPAQALEAVRIIRDTLNRPYTGD
jgi:hypothetical protein